MAVWDLDEIRNKIRQVTGRYSPEELSNRELLERINQYTQYTLPAELKLERFHTFYEFLTEANVRDYTLPAGYVNFEPPATIDNLLLLWYQDPNRFIENNPMNVARQTIGTGNGATTNFTSTASGFPILPNTTVVTDDNEVFEDTNTVWTTSNVNLTGSLGGSGTINYSTGAVNVTFSTAPLSGQNIIFSYIQFNPGRPTAVLLYNNKFTFFPVPDTAYRFKAKAYANSLIITNTGAIQTEFINSSDRPLENQWGPLISYGTARQIHADWGEIDAYGEVTALYKEQQSYAIRRTNQNLLNTRAAPHF